MSQWNTKLLTTLSAAPVLGVAMDNVTMLRLDQCGGLAPGNKAFKLRRNLIAARDSGAQRIVSFGGAWSNHLHALAAVAKVEGIESIGLVRGDDNEADTAMLADARRWGMQLHRIARSEYRRRNDPQYLLAVRERYGPCLVLPEGGANIDGMLGCREIAGLISGSGYVPGKVLVAVGTGTTLAGLALGLPVGFEVLGVSALKGAADLEARVSTLLAEAAIGTVAPWSIMHREHCGGFARVNQELQAFMLAFEAVQGLPLEPVYTGKLMYAIHRRLASGEWPREEPLLAVHTGGLQGRRGYPWLQAQ